MRLLGIWLSLALVVCATAAKLDSLDRLLQLLASEKRDLQSRAINEPTCGRNKYQNTITKSAEHYSHLKRVLKVVLKDDPEAEKLTSRILNGRNARAGEFPWIVFELINGESDQASQCGGSLINSQWILTAAHCIFGTAQQNHENFGKTPSKFKFYLGEHNTNEDVREASEQELDAEKIIVHKMYDIKNKENNNDIALVKLKKPVKYSDNISPICLPASAVPAGTKCYAAGWGADKTGNAAEILRKVELQVLSKAECEKRRGGLKLAKGMLCAAKLPGVKFADACRGDSGGPLSCLIGGKFQLVGVTSYGVDCTSGNSYPGVYADVVNYRKWIEDVLSGKEDSTSGGSSPSGNSPSGGSPSGGQGNGASGGQGMGGGSDQGNGSNSDGDLGDDGMGNDGFGDDDLGNDGFGDDDNFNFDDMYKSLMKLLRN